MTEKKLREKASELWEKYQKGGQPDEKERALLREAYNECCLPDAPMDNSTNPYWWVEDGFPPLA